MSSSLSVRPPFSVIPERSPGRACAEVVVVTGSYGAGHDAAAREIARALSAEGHAVRTYDIADLYPCGAGRLLRSLYFTQLAVLPRSWGWLLGVVGGQGRISRTVTRMMLWLLAVLPSRSLSARLGDAEVVLSTHPFASAALGRLRRRGRLAATVTTYLTDASVHPWWVHRGVDTHLAIHREAAQQAVDHGAHDVRLIRPLVAPAVTRAEVTQRRVQVLAKHGIPAARPVALVVGGSEGVGELAGAATDIAATGQALPVVVCGHNEGLRRALGGVPGTVALGWVDDLAELIAASDCVVQNAGGFTSLEALALGTPMLSYRCIPGHGTENAAALEADGLTRWARESSDLPAMLAAALGDVGLPVPPQAWAQLPLLTEALGLAVRAGAAA